MAAQMRTKRIGIFLAVAFGIPWAADLVIYLSGGMKNNPLLWATMANYIAISTPALANVAARLITREGWGHLWLRPNFRRGWRFYLAAWLLPLLAVCVGAAIFYLVFPQSFDPNLGEVRKALAAVPSLAAAPWMGLLIILIQIMVVSFIINGIVSIGEEFGWRAYLLPKLIERFTGDTDTTTNTTASAARKAALLIGVIWSVWHVPLFALAAAAGTPFPNLLSYFIFVCADSVFLTWVTLRSGSVWPASIGHGMVNATSALPLMLLKGPDNPLLGPSPIGLLGGAGLIILALLLLFNRKAFAGMKELPSEKAQSVRLSV